MRSVIIGGGVGGCAVAAALRGSCVGSNCTVIERRPTGLPGGMGFILMPNGIAALENIAPEFDWRSAGRTLDRVSLRTATGRILAEQTIEPATCVSRERFLGMLREATGATRFLDGRNLSGLVRQSDGVTKAAALDNGSMIEGDAFFGCDGAASRTRAILFPEAQLADVVVKEVVSMAHAPALAKRLGSTFHKFHDEEGGLAVGLLAESAERVVWFLQFDARRWEFSDTSAAGIAQFTRDRIAGWAPDLLEALACTDFARSHLWPTRDLPPMASISCQNLALLGDAAHACLPFTSQGANGALVDALILKGLLAEVTDQAGLVAAFAQYSESRRPHHRRMFLEGRRLREAFLAPLLNGMPALPLVA